MTMWLILRTSGFLVLGLLTVAVALGLAGPGIADPTKRLVSITVHRAAAVLGAGLLLLHVTAAVLDSWVTVTWPAVFIPGTSTWEPLWIGLGALAFDAVLLLSITSALRHRFASLWWNVHVVSYVAYGMAWLHAIGVGSDVREPVMLITAAASAAAIGLAGLVRLSRRGAPSGIGLPQNSRRPNPARQEALR